MELAKTLSGDRVRAQMKAKSKKRAIELIAEALSNSAPDIDPDDVFDALIAREKLGSTGIGGGVAVPHCRLDSCETPTLGLFKLFEPVDFDAVDHQPVDIIIALMVPNDANHEYLQLLSQVAKVVTNPSACQSFRDAITNESLFEHFNVAVSHLQNDGIDKSKTS